MAGLQYVARKPMTVDGRTIQPGEIVPEAATWKNVKAYVNDGSLAIAVEVPEGTAENAGLRAEVDTLAERVAALEALVAGAGDVDGAIDVTPSDGGADDGEVVASPDHDKGADDQATEVVDLDSMSVDELRDLATEREIEGRSSMKKAELIAALRGTEA